MVLNSRIMPCIIVCFVLSALISNGRALSRTKRGGWMPGTRPPGVACAFNPCSVPNFCGEGRTCDLDSNCVHHCLCDTNSKHKLCTTTTDKDDGNDVSNVTTTEKTITCTFNPCNSPFGVCTDGRKCELDQFCRVMCICTDDSTHSSCDDDRNSTNATVATVTKTTPTTTDDQGCGLHSDIGCQHGQCISDGSTMTCECDDGWAGAICDKNKSTCALSCQVGFECIWFSEIIQMCIKSVNITNESACNTAYTIRSVSERVCGPGLECEYGICVLNNGTRECKCDPGAQGTRCEVTCCKDCGVNGTCILDDDNEEICECVGNFTGENCTRTDDLQAEILPEEVTWHLWVVGACVVVLVTLLFLIVCVPYVMWRHRVILVMKIVHFFQSYEDDDDRSWDAFVSYKSVEKDEKFVVHTLFPKLEQEFGFRLNLHFRDFNPGENISNNIIKAVQSSRRTIMVVTPQYVQSEFTRLEMQVAQQEMLKRRHRIIPVLLEDVKDCSASMDPNLKMILGSVTYIQWPGHDADTKKIDAFWKRLKLALPKKKPVESDTTSSAVLRSSNWQSSTVDPNSVAVKIVNENGVHASERCENVYTTIDDAKAADPEEDYDTLNEADMDGHNESTDHTCNNVTEQEKYLNILNSSPC